MSDAFGRAFLRLTLEIEKHIPGYVDAYIGPAGLQAEVATAPKKTPAALLADLASCQDLLPHDDAQRAEFAAGLLKAVGGTLRKLNGEEIPYPEEVALLYDIHPRPVDEVHFTAANLEIDTLLPGSGSLAERLDERRKRLEVTYAQLLPLLELALAETRRRTAELVDLVPGEAVTLQLTQDQPWGAYNWYRGQAQSLVEFNTDIPVSSTGILSTMAHEAYPGHHTEAQLKERHLVQERGYLEFSSALLHSPTAVIAEGIATTALEIIFPDNSAHVWNAEVLLPAAGMAGIENAETLQRLADAQRALRYVSGNAAFYYHTGRFDKEQTIDYLHTYGLRSPERAAKSFSFISSPLFRSYIFTYTEGYDLLARAAGNGAKTNLFRRLLTEPILPSSLAEIASLPANQN